MAVVSELRAVYLAVSFDDNRIRGFLGSGGGDVGLGFPQWSPPLRLATPPIYSLLGRARHAVGDVSATQGPGFASDRLCESDQGFSWTLCVFI